MPTHRKDHRLLGRIVNRSAASPLSSRTGAARPLPKSSQEMRDDTSQPREVSGLSKTQAEDLLDCLEAAGYQFCQLSYVHGEGFRVRLPF
jgi:hypothetical protein